MKRLNMRNALILIAAVIGLAAAGSLDIVRAEGKEQSLRGRIIAVGIPGASAISAVGTFLAGGPIHDTRHSPPIRNPDGSSIQCASSSEADRISAHQWRTLISTKGRFSPLTHAAPRPW